MNYELQTNNYTMFVDIFIIGAAAFGFYAGFSKGIIKTFITTVGTIIAFIATLKLTPITADLLSTVLPTGSGLVPIIAFVVTLLIAMLAIRIVGQALESTLAAADLGFINKIVGGLLLAALGVFMLSCVFTFMDRASILTSEMKTTSQLYQHLEPIPQAGFDVAKTVFPIVQDMFNGIFDLFDQIPTEKTTEKN